MNPAPFACGAPGSPGGGKNSCSRNVRSAHSMRCATRAVQTSQARRRRQQLRHLRKVEKRLVCATESPLQVCGLQGDCRSRIVRAEYRLETQQQRIDADVRGARLLALHYGPRVSQESGWQLRIASGQFAVDREGVAHDRHVMPPRIVSASYGTVPGLQQCASRTGCDGFPDPALDMQRPLAHRFALWTLRRRCSQCAIHGGREGDDVLAGSPGQHHGKIVTNRSEIPVRGQ